MDRRALDDNKKSQCYLAHVCLGKNGAWQTHELGDHLRSVAHLAKNFADEFGCGDWAFLAGLWHDLGKYSSEFQNYIKSKSGYDSEAHLEQQKGRVDHSTAGAIHSIEKLKKRGQIIAYLIAGHHAGLPDWNSEKAGASSLSTRISNTSLYDRVCCLDQVRLSDDLPVPVSKPPGCDAHALWIRMLFSCLVDADFLDTESFMNAERNALRGGYPSLSELEVKFSTFMANKLQKVESNPLNQLRAAVLKRCKQAAEWESGIFSLSVPTGGGKTLSSMAFALNHALMHGKRRIIYVIPYTSIIEQTANEFRSIFGDAVVEHHSNFDSEKETTQSRLASENWDAPIIVTTNVQFFESLFAARSSRTRKLHNIVNSVVILDEVQLLETKFLGPINKMLQALSDYYNMTAVLCTATQPEFVERIQHGRRFQGLRNVREIIDEPHLLYDKLKRVRVQVPDSLSEKRSWEDIAQELQIYPSVLCIVNRRDDCRELFRLMPVGTYHLSALMCGQHRSDVISEIKQKLKAGEPIRVISTQLVEAGVDLDFPVVYRALAGIDSITQAAGRCNREGRLDLGKVVVFIPPKPASQGILRKGETIARQMLQTNKADPLHPESISSYFQQFYSSINDFDSERILDDLESRDLEFQFRTAAEKFKLIDDSSQASVFVHYGDAQERIKALFDGGPSRDVLRRLQRYSVNIPRGLFLQLLSEKKIQELRPASPGYFAQVEGLYHHELGFLGGDEHYQEPEVFIC